MSDLVTLAAVAIDEDRTSQHDASKCTCADAYGPVSPYCDETARAGMVSRDRAEAALTREPELARGVLALTAQLADLESRHTSYEQFCRSENLFKTFTSSDVVRLFVDSQTEIDALKKERAELRAVRAETSPGLGQEAVLKAQLADAQNEISHLHAVLTYDLKQRLSLGTALQGVTEARDEAIGIALGQLGADDDKVRARLEALFTVGRRCP